MTTPEKQFIVIGKSAGDTVTVRLTDRL